MSIAEVAKLADVSLATVSRVINGHNGVSISTATSVRRAMSEVGFEPAANRPGPKPGSKRTSDVTNVLFLVFSDRPSSTATGFQQLVAGVSSRLEERNANLVMKFVSGSEEAAALNLTNPRVDGLLLHGSIPIDGVVPILRQLPTVWLMNNAVRPSWGDQVMPANEHIGVMAADYLVKVGRDRLVFFNLLPSHWGLRLRARAFLDAAETLGATAERSEPSRTPSDAFFIDLASGTTTRFAEAADALADELLRSNPRPNGIFVAEDAQASIFVPALQRRGVDLSPGGDLTLISCNNERAYLMGLSPCPPTIDIRIEAIGRRGADQLLWRINQGSNDDRMSTTIEPRIVLP